MGNYEFDCYGRSRVLVVPLPMENAHVCCKGSRIPIRTARRKDFLLVNVELSERGVRKDDWVHQGSFEEEQNDNKGLAKLTDEELIAKYQRARTLTNAGVGICRVGLALRT